MLLVAAIACGAGCAPGDLARAVDRYAMPDRVTLGASLDADGLRPTSYQVSGQWILKK